MLIMFIADILFHLMVILYVVEPYRTVYVMPLPSKIVDKSIIFGGCLLHSSVHSFTCPYRYCYHEISWMAWAVWIKLTGNNYWPLWM